MFIQTAPPPADEAALSPSAFFMLLGELAQGVCAGLLVALVAAQMLFPEQCLGHDSPVHLLTVLVLGVLLLLPIWRGSVRRLRLALALLLGISVMNVAFSVWLLGPVSLWKLPFLSVTFTLLFVSWTQMPRIGQTAGTLFWGLSPRQMMVLALGLLLLGAISMLVWLGPGGTSQDANTWLRGLEGAVVIALVLLYRLSGMQQGRDAARHLADCAALFLTLLAIMSAALLLSFDWLNQHSPHAMPTSNAALLLVLFAMSLLVHYPPARPMLRWLCVVIALLWSVAAARNYPLIMLPMLPLAGLVLGLFLPGRGWWLAWGLWGLVLAQPAWALGEMQLPLVMNALLGSVVLGMMLWLNRRAMHSPTGAHRLGVVDRRTQPRGFAHKVGLGVALFVGVLGTLGYRLLYQIESRAHQHEATVEARLLAQRIGERLRNAENLALALRQQPLGKISTQAEFEHAVSALQRLAGDGMVLQWAPDAVIRFAHPLPGNEKVIGYNLLADPARGAVARKILETGKPLWSGPFDLIQGGTGMAYRAPIYQEGRLPSPQNVVGLAITLVRFPQVLRQLIASQGNHEFQIWIQTQGAERQQVWGRLSTLSGDSADSSGFASADIGANAMGWALGSEAIAKPHGPIGLHVEVRAWPPCIPWRKVGPIAYRGC